MERRRNGFTHKQKREVRERQEGRCACCGQTPHKTLDVHHVIPLSHDGPNTIDNAVGLCRGEGTCNCHPMIDKLALERNIYFDEQTMAENVEYVVGLLNSPHLDDEPVAWGNLAADD